MWSTTLTFQHYFPLQQPIEIPKQPEVDFDLDSLLSDLTSFDPTSAVSKSQPPPPPQRIDSAPQPAFIPVETPVRSGNSSVHSTPQHYPHPQQSFSEPSPTPPSTPGSTPSHGSQTQVERNVQPKTTDVGPEVVMRSHTEARSPEHRRPAGTTLLSIPYSCCIVECLGDSPVLLKTSTCSVVGVQSIGDSINTIGLMMCSL